MKIRNPFASEDRFRAGFTDEELAAIGMGLAAHLALAREYGGMHPNIALTSVELMTELGQIPGVAPDDVFVRQGQMLAKHIGIEDEEREAQEQGPDRDETEGRQGPPPEREEGAVEGPPQEGEAGPGAVELDTTIYVLPSQPHTPPRAMLLSGQNTPVGFVVAHQEMVTWSADLGMWMFPNATPVPEELGDMITAHAKDLGVEW